MVENTIGGGLRLAEDCQIAGQMDGRDLIGAETGRLAISDRVEGAIGAGPLICEENGRSG